MSRMGDALKKAGVTPERYPEGKDDHPVTTPVSGRYTPQRGNGKTQRNAKTRAKMWYITRRLLQQNPGINDADIRRGVKRQFGEDVAPDIVKEARYIFARKVESGEIVVAGRMARLNAVQDLYLRLSAGNKGAFIDWVNRGALRSEVQQFYREATQAGLPGGDQ